MRTENPRLKRILSLLVCPFCRGELKDCDVKLVCQSCKRDYSIHNDKIYFIQACSTCENFDKLKRRLKRWLGRYYYAVGVNIFAPDFPFFPTYWLRRYANPASQVVVDVGAGNRRIDKDIICLDGVDYGEVDIVCDVSALPFKDGSIDVLLSLMLLEHISNLPKTLESFRRCTKAGGINLHHLPFMYPFHASPDDFRRFTHEGAKQLFADWQILICTNTSGPVTLMLISSYEFFSALFSFGNRRLKPWFYLFFSVLLFPLKYLDFIFVNRSPFLSMAPTILTVFRRPVDNINE